MPKTILILAANPRNTDRLRLDEEVREIDEGLRRARQRDEFHIQQKWAVRPDDFRRAMLDHEPKIVHFSGHGAGQQGIVLEDNQGAVKPVSAKALQGLFQLFPNVECVLLNACYSEVQANAIAQTVPCVIGMSQSVGDAAAIKFALGFYDALGAGKSYADAFNFGRNALELDDIPGHLIPVMKTAIQTTRGKSMPEPFSSSESDLVNMFKDFRMPDLVSKPVPVIGLKGVHSQYEIMKIDWQANSLRLIEQADEYTGDGRLTRQALQNHIQRLEKERANERGEGLWRRAGSFDSVEQIDEQLAKARALLRDMHETPAEAVDYLPPKMRDFPDYLRRLVVEMLMTDDSKTEFKITQFVVDNARSRYHRLPERTEADKQRKEDALADIEELAKRLGFY